MLQKSVLQAFPQSETMLSICNCIPEWTGPGSKTMGMLKYAHKYFFEDRLLKLMQISKFRANNHDH